MLMDVGPYYRGVQGLIADSQVFLETFDCLIIFFCVRKGLRTEKPSPRALWL